MEQIDFYGAYFQQDVTFDKASITLYTLNKYLKETLTLVIAILTHSVFPESEIKTYVENTKQRLAINLEKNDFLEPTKETTVSDIKTDTISQIKNVTQEKKTKPKTHYYLILTDILILSLILSLSLSNV